MRYCIFSDVHSNLEALETLIRVAKSEAIDVYLCVGDLVGYAANPNECVGALKSLGTIAVSGNHDQASLGLFPAEYFNDTAAKSILWTKYRLDDESKAFLNLLPLVYKDGNLTAVHSSLENPQSFNYIFDADASRSTFGLLESNLCFIGHTHVPQVFIMDKAGFINNYPEDEFEVTPDKRYIVNTGSVGQPRDGNPFSSFCIYDTELKYISIKRAAYDCKLTRQKILDVGLPRSLGDRLLSGR